MIRNRHFILLGVALYLVLILFEHFHITHSVSDAIAQKIHVPAKQEVKAKSKQLAETKNEQLLNTNATNCIPLPPPQANIPRIYVHIGPHKTGTTSLQDYLACNTQFLKRQNTYYLGKINMYDVKGCIMVPPDFFRPLIQTPSYQALSKLKYIMHYYQSRGKNVIMSSEDIFNIPKNHTDELFANLTHVYPVVGYRRYYEWLLSAYRFNYGEPKWYDLEVWRAWDGHDTIPSFREFVGMYNGRMHPTLEVVKKFHEMQQSTARPCFQVLNFHIGDITQEFMKLITPKDSVPTSVYMNVNDESKVYAVDSEVLALKLHRERKIHIVLSRRVVVDVIQYKMSLMYKNSTPPLNCLSFEEETALLETTKTAEKQILPDYYNSPAGKSMLEVAFRQASEINAFCNIDLDEMLKDPSWEKLLIKFKAGKLRQDDFKPLSQPK